MKKVIVYKVYDSNGDLVAGCRTKDAAIGIKNLYSRPYDCCYIRKSYICV